MRIIAQPFPYRIPPNVAGDVLDDLLRSQNVSVVAHLPETLAMSLFEFIRGALFESVDELDQIGSLRKSFTKEVDVVGHDAIGVKRKTSLSGNLQQMPNQPLPPRLIRKEGRALLGPNGHEINSEAAVVFRGPAQAFLKKRHAGKANTSCFVEAGL